MSTKAIPGRAGPKGPTFAVLASNEVGLLLITVGAVIVFSYLAPGFDSPFNIYALTRVLAIDVVIGFSMMVVLVTGGLNLAVGAIGVSAVMVGGWAMQVAGLPIIVSALLALAFGAALGALNGILTVAMRVHSFVVTLATMSLFFGAMIVLTQAEAFNALPAEFVSLAKLKTWFFASSMLYASIVVGLLLWWLFHHTLIGRQILAAGANPSAARLSGVPVERTIVVCHGLSGALAAFAGLMLTARNGAALPSMAGQLGMDWLLPAFLAPVLGGTLLTGGTLSVAGTFLGAAMVTVLSNGLLQLQVGEFWVQAFLGVILLVAVVLDRLRAHVMAKRRVR
ncbi:monosaccharide ABC transporter membrane protein, CUT2 family [Tranquillimonas alkanivorans]|uniref:Monosaccharide ABC transporter membrane protein, CUT2 family n=1 Tax=Tranquillimonas alkanivorans TaxID=441119 RepID=A0A1I5VK78_9RHOB|nr:monosaccharide ABC transporter membrane protein, CUT2 family [Tranquillimonas alkanivorans]